MATSHALSQTHTKKKKKIPISSEDSNPSPEAAASRQLCLCFGRIRLCILLSLSLSTMTYSLKIDVDLSQIFFSRKRNTIIFISHSFSLSSNPLKFVQYALTFVHQHFLPLLTKSIIPFHFLSLFSSLSNQT